MHTLLFWFIFSLFEHAKSPAVYGPYNPWTSKKDRLSTIQHCLPRLQEIVVPVATANMMSQHAVPKQNLNKNILMAESST
jgi:hypothetical protein